MMDQDKQPYPVTNIVSAEKLSSEKQDRWLFKDISFKIEPGQLLHIKGANGTGKTTLLRILCGLTTPDNGKIYWGNKPILKQRDQYHTQLSYVGHHDGIKQDLSVEENLKVAAVLAQGKQTQPRLYNLDQVLNKMGLIKKKTSFAHALSAGQRRRLALARCLLNETSIWVLDEPLTALDSQGTQLVEEMVRQHLERDGIAILTSHHVLSVENNHYQELHLS
ncbi:MAG: cytochrome c biogenesis heme-transporting ATPase CcmA [Thioalkalispiraceae bacterium]|jgi:heme exporter protein A